MANLNDLKMKIQNAINTLSKEKMKEIGEFAAETIVKRTRLGYGVLDSGGERQKLKPLSPGYIEQRKSFNGLSGKTSPSKSNLTRTGQLLDSIGVRNVTRNTVTIAPSGRRNDGLNNQDVANYVSEDRPFLNISNNDMRQIEQMAQKIIEDHVKSEIDRIT